MRWIRRFDSHLMVILLLSSFVIAPLTRPGYPVTGVGFRPIWELNALAQCGGWPFVAGHRDLVRGDGLLPRYVALAFRSIAPDSATAIKWSLVIAYVVGGTAMYGWLRRRWGSPGALLTAVLYTFLPYRQAVAYISGGLRDPWVMALLPLCGWALDAFSRRFDLRRGLLAFLAWAALGMVSVGQAVWFALIAGLALLALRRPLRSLLPVAPAVPLLVWCILAAPASPIPFSDHYVYPFQLFSASWNAAPSNAGWIREMPFQLGLIPLCLAILALSQAGKEDGAAPARPLVILLIGVVAAALLSMRISALFWGATRLDHLLMYPWQMVGFAAFGLTLLAGSVVRQVRQLGELPWLAALIALTVISVYGTLAPAWTETGPGEMPIAIYGDHQLALLDYQFIGHVYPGAEVQLDVTWQALAPLRKDYTVFVQVLDNAETVRGQQDGQPRQGESPTSSWVPGQIIPDSYTLPIDPSGPSSGYHVIVGFYDLATGKRLAVGQDDKATLDPRAATPARPSWPCQEMS